MPTAYERLLMRKAYTPPAKSHPSAALHQPTWKPDTSPLDACTTQRAEELGDGVQQYVSRPFVSLWEPPSWSQEPSKQNLSTITASTRASNKKRGRSEEDTPIDERLSHLSLDATSTTTMPRSNIGTPPAESSPLEGSSTAAADASGGSPQVTLPHPTETAEQANWSRSDLFEQIRQQQRLIGYLREDIDLLVWQLDRHTSCADFQRNMGIPGVQTWQDIYEMYRREPINDQYRTWDGKTDRERQERANRLDEQRREWSRLNEKQQLEWSSLTNVKEAKAWSGLFEKQKREWARVTAQQRREWREMDEAQQRELMNMTDDQQRQEVGARMEQHRQEVSARMLQQQREVGEKMKQQQQELDKKSKQRRQELRNRMIQQRHKAWERMSEQRRGLGNKMVQGHQVRLENPDQQQRQVADKFKSTTSHSKARGVVKKEEERKVRQAENECRRKRIKRGDVKVERVDKDLSEISKLSLSPNHTVAEVTQDMQHKLNLNPMPDKAQ
ncbi:hypothetical protein BGX33_008414 [Mortierella sp. NVP41]|nr:hypothetical protein BGX33_008414 [Mortierella sp. NVP41]